MMPILALGHCKRRFSGFTLLEIMVVLVIIGISLGLVSPHLMKNDDDMLYEESMRLTALLEYAADVANSRGNFIAWSPTSSGYRFLQHNDEKMIWQPIVNDDLLKERELTEGIHLNAVTQQQTTITTNSLLLFSPSGLQAPFQIIMTVGEKKRIVQGNLLGQVTLLPHHTITPHSP